MEFTLFDFIGIAASIIVVISLMFKTRTYAGTLCMRELNFIGSFVFIIYAIWGIPYPKNLPTIITNTFAIFINGYYIIKEYFNHKLEVKHGRTG